MDLLEDGTDVDEKIINEEVVNTNLNEGIEEEKTSTGPDIELRSLTPDSLSRIISTPLNPAYNATRRVSRVWAKDQRVEALYRYTNFDRLVYPPGFLDEEEE